MTTSCALHIKNLSFSYGNRKALDHIKLAIAAATISFILDAIAGYNPRSGLLGRKNAA